jgi:signal transduction histidine kinase
MATLFVMQGRDTGRRFELRDDCVSIGRDNSNRIQLNDSEVSRHHAEVRPTPEGVLVVDLQSSNGTFVNSERVEQRMLQTGDRLLIGRTLLLFTGIEDSSSDQLAHDVDIIGTHREENESRIVKSLAPSEGSQIFSFSDPGDSPWLARARSNLQVMYRTALAVSHTLDIDELLQRILELIFEWVEADRGCIMLINQETGELEPAASRNRKGVQAEEKMAISRTILDFVMERKEGVLTSDARDDQRWDPGQSIVKAGVREAICVPMQGRYGIVGVVYLDTYTAPGSALLKRSVNKFNEEQLKLMVAIGHQAALAVEDTSYYSALVQAERLAAMGQTIATLSHHVKNILQGIRGGSYLIEEGLKISDNEVVRKGWRIVEKNQEKISGLVLDMLTFSKERKPELIDADLNETVGDVVELMQSRAAEACVRLEFLPAAETPALLFDPDLLHRAILNVVTNAIDACERREGACVSVAGEYDAENRLAKVHVRDNGEGIPPEDIKRIFNLFESKKGARGTGLGLPVSQKIMREHGGDILITSSPGAGSCFTLQFPARFPDGSAVGKTLA